VSLIFSLFGNNHLYYLIVDDHEIDNDWDQGTAVSFYQIYIRLDNKIDKFHLQGRYFDAIAAWNDYCGVNNPKINATAPEGKFTISYCLI
jgi:hypothetical protein